MSRSDRQALIRLAQLETGKRRADTGEEEGDA